MQIIRDEKHLLFILDGLNLAAYKWCIMCVNIYYIIYIYIVAQLKTQGISS